MKIHVKVKINDENCPDKVTESTSQDSRFSENSKEYNNITNREIIHYLSIFYKAEQTSATLKRAFSDFSKQGMNTENLSMEELLTGRK